jgi:hypothetical protein
MTRSLWAAATLAVLVIDVGLAMSARAQDTELSVLQQIEKNTAATNTQLAALNATLVKLEADFAPQKASGHLLVLEFASPGAGIPAEASNPELICSKLGGQVVTTLAGIPGNSREGGAPPIDQRVICRVP